MDYYKLVPSRELKGEKVISYLRKLWKRGVNPIDFVLVCRSVYMFRDSHGLSGGQREFIRNIIGVYATLLGKLLRSRWKSNLSFKRKLIKEVSKAIFSEVHESECYYEWKSYPPIRHRDLIDIMEDAILTKKPIELLLLVWVRDYEKLKNIFVNLRDLLSLYKFKTDPKLRRKIRAKLKKLEKLKPEKRNTELEKFREEVIKEVVDNARKTHSKHRESGKKIYPKLIPGQDIKGEKVISYLRDLWVKGVNPIDFMKVCIHIYSFHRSYELSMGQSVFISNILQVYEDVLEKLLRSTWREGPFKEYLVKNVSEAVLLDIPSSMSYSGEYGNYSFPRYGSMVDILANATTSRHPLESLLLVWIKDYKSLKNIFSNIRHITALYKFKTDPKLRRRIRAKLKKLEKLKPKEREKELKRLRKEAFESVAEFR